MHSDGKTSKSWTLERYAKWETKVIVAVDQLNEAIDLPETKHVVFARGTDSQTIFLQQLWRALRWNGVVYIWDYVTSFTNMEQINFINSEIEALSGKWTWSSVSRVNNSKRVKVFEWGIDWVRTEVSVDSQINEQWSSFWKIALLSQMVWLVNGNNIAERLIQEFKDSVKDDTVNELTLIGRLMKRWPKKISENEFIPWIVSNRPNLLTSKWKISPFNMFESRCKGKIWKSDDELMQQFLLDKCGIDKRGSDAWFAILALIYSGDVIQSIKSRINRVDDSLGISEPNLLTDEPKWDPKIEEPQSDQEWENPIIPVVPTEQPENEPIPDGRKTLEELWYEIEKLEWMILPWDPDAKARFLSNLSKWKTITDGGFTEWIDWFFDTMEIEEKKYTWTHYDRTKLFDEIIKNNDQFQLTWKVKEWLIQSNSTRKTSYFVFTIRVKYSDGTEGIKTVLICNQYANATFIVDGEMSDFDLLTLYKRNLPNYEEIRISFTAPDLRKRFVTNTLKDKLTGHIDTKALDEEDEMSDAEGIEVSAIEQYGKVNYIVPTTGEMWELVKKIKNRVPEFILSMIKFIPWKLADEIRESGIADKPADLHKLIESSKKILWWNMPTIIDIIWLIYGSETVEIIRQQWISLIKERIIQETSMLDPIQWFRKLWSDRIKDIFKCPKAEDQYFYRIYGLTSSDVKNFGPKTGSKHYMKHKYKIFVALWLIDTSYRSDYFYNTKYDELTLRKQIEEQLLWKGRKNAKKKVVKPSDYLFSWTLSERIHLFHGTLTLESDIVNDIVYYSWSGELKIWHTIQKDARLKFLKYMYGEEAIEQYKFEKIEEMRNKLRDKLSNIPSNEPVKTIKDLLYNLSFSPKITNYIPSDILENVFLVEKNDIAIANRESRGNRWNDSPTYARTEILRKMGIANDSLSSNYDFVYGTKLTSRLGVPIDRTYKENPPHDWIRLNAVLQYIWRNKPELTLEMFALSTKVEFITYFKLSDPQISHDLDFTTLANFVNIPVGIDSLGTEHIHKLLRLVYGEVTYERLKRNMIEYMIRNKLGVDININLTKDMVRRFLVHYPRTRFPESDSDYATYLRLFGFNIGDLTRSNGNGRLDLLNIWFDREYYGRQLKDFNDIEFAVDDN